MNTNLNKYGLTKKNIEEAETYKNLFAARVTEQHRELYKVVCENGELHAAVSGKFAFENEEPSSFPAVGDWVMIDRKDDKSGNAVIQAVLGRKSVLARQAVDGTSAQIIAANIDIIFICMSLNADFNLRRLERYLTIAWESMATPVIVLTKADLCNDLQSTMNEVYSVSMGVDVITCSSVSGSGYESIGNYIKEGQTTAFVGSSGVGKSTLINRLMNSDVLATSEIREDDSKGRHTTTHRQLLLLPGGGIVIDTPGMRELQIFAGNLSKTFEDIEELAQNCKFADCTHSGEPGCAVTRAINDGILPQKRFESYQKLKRETSYSGMSSRQLENEKINRMFGGKNSLKSFKKEIKNRNKR